MLEGFLFQVEVFASVDLSGYLHSPYFCFYRAMSTPQKDALVSAFNDEAERLLAVALAPVRTEVTGLYEGLPEAKRGPALTALAARFEGASDLASSLGGVLTDPLKARLVPKSFRPDRGGVAEGTKAGAQRFLLEEAAGFLPALEQAAKEVVKQVRSEAVSVLGEAS